MGLSLYLGDRGQTSKQNINMVDADGTGSQGVLGEAVTEVKRPQGQGGM